MYRDEMAHIRVPTISCIIASILLNELANAQYLEEDRRLANAQDSKEIRQLADVQDTKEKRTMGFFSSFIKCPNEASDIVKVPYATHYSNNAESNLRIDLISGPSIKNSLTMLNSSNDILSNHNVSIFVIIHGFKSNSSTSWALKVKDALLAIDAHVFIIDHGSSDKSGIWIPTNYGNSVSNARAKSQLIAPFLEEVARYFGIKIKYITLIGHSLGAHIAGGVQLFLPDELGLIHAFDAAMPCFGNRPTRSELNKDSRLEVTFKGLSYMSATLVISLHLDGNYYGLDDDIGHYDIMVNDGLDQPNCWLPQCDHSFSLDNFSPGSNDVYHKSKINDRCYPIATRCSDYTSYRVGKCGCRRGSCIFTGIASYAERVELNANEGLEEIFDFDPNDDPLQDLTINRESNGSGTGQIQRRPRYYIRTAQTSPLCLYNYRIVIQVQSKKPRVGPYFLSIPLNQSDYSYTNRAMVRKIRVGYHARTTILSPNNNSHILTTLISFEEIAYADCSRDPDIKAYANEEFSSGYGLCSFLKFNHATLWAKNRDDLTNSLIVSIEYMSGITPEQRMQGSTVLYSGKQIPVSVEYLLLVGEYVEEEIDSAKWSIKLKEKLPTGLSTTPSDRNSSPNV